MENLPGCGEGLLCCPRCLGRRGKVVPLSQCEVQVAAQDWGMRLWPVLLEVFTLGTLPLSCPKNTLIYFDERKNPKQFHWKFIFCVFFPLCWLPNKREVVFYFANRSKARKYKVTSLCFDPFAVWQISNKSWPLLPSQCEFYCSVSNCLHCFSVVGWAHHSINGTVSNLSLIITPGFTIIVLGCFGFWRLAFMVLVSDKDAVSAFPIKRSLAHTPFGARFDVKRWDRRADCSMKQERAWFHHSVSVVPQTLGLIFLLRNLKWTDKLSEKSFRDR